MTTAIAEAWKRTRPARPAPPARRFPVPRRQSARQRPPPGLRAPYEGVETNRQLEDWIVGAHQPRELTSAWLSILRERSRDLARHAPAFIGAVQIIVDNVIGANGFRVNPQSHTDEDGRTLNAPLNRRLARLWKDWSCEVDRDQRESLEMLLRTAVREYVEAGEVLIVESVPPAGATGDRVVPLQIEVVEAERLDHSFDRARNTRDQRASGNEIRHSIEFNPFGQRVAYWITKVGDLGELTTERERITADRVHHVFHRSRASQERGVPWLWGATVLCHDLDDLMDTELTTAQVAACLTGFIKREQAGLFGSTQERDAEDDRPIHRFAPGMIFDLRGDESIEMMDPNRPSGAFEPFANFILRSIAKTLGISFESISGDYRGVNFASGRLGALGERKTFRRIQAILVQLAVRPIWRSFVRSALLAGKLPPTVSLIDYLINWRRHTAADYVGAGWEHQDPLKEVTAAALRVLAGVSTVDEEAAALGRDWRAIALQRALETQTFRELGLPIVTVGGAQVVTGQGTDGTKPIEVEQDRENEDEPEVEPEVEPDSEESEEREQERIEQGTGRGRQQIEALLPLDFAALLLDGTRGG